MTAKNEENDFDSLSHRHEKRYHNPKNDSDKIHSERFILMEVPIWGLSPQNEAKIINCYHVDYQYFTFLLYDKYF